MSDVKQVITVSGSHWGDIFALPCILEVSKMHAEDTEPRPFATMDCALCVWCGEYSCASGHMSDDCDEAYPGDKLIEYADGKWQIEKHYNKQQ